MSADEDRDTLLAARQPLDTAQRILIGLLRVLSDVPVRHWDADFQPQCTAALGAVERVDRSVADAMSRCEIAKAEATIAFHKKALEKKS